MDNNVIIKNDNNIMMAQERRSKIFLAWYHHCPLCLCYIKCVVLTYTQPQNNSWRIVSTTLQNTTGLETGNSKNREDDARRAMELPKSLKILETCKKRLYAHR